ncbi:MAG: GHKL domain-containing protein [Candidatus Cloacimonetes bacterium]|nr:GHKL domain-containing protein [Candidatus Cloacimonadota bacterium]
MKLLFTALEKRIFIAYFFGTFFIILLLILIEWQIVRFSIIQHENISIQNELFQLEKSQNKYASKSLSKLIKHKDDKLFLKLISKRDTLSLNKQYDLSTVFVFDADKKIFLGESWDLINKYLNDIFQEIQPNFFIAKYGSKMFYIFYVPIIKKNELIAYLVETKTYSLPPLPNNTLIKVKKTTYPIPTNFFENDLKIHSVRLNLKVENLTSKKEKFSIERVSINTAVGLFVMYDIRNNPIGIYSFYYNRKINAFAQQGVLFFILILMAITILMITFFGNWFTKTILQPIKMLSDKMLEITHNPSLIEPIASEYKGVLGDLVSTFNSMNFSLDKYGKSLEEYKIITKNINTGIFWLNENFEVILCNETLIKIFELENINEIIGKNLNIFLNLSYLLQEKVKNESIILSNLEINIKKKKKVVTLNIRSMPDQTNHTIVGSITDITSQVKEKKAREALELELIKINKLAEVGRRVEGIVHNMNSPLNSILGYAQLMKKDFNENEDIEKIINSGKVLAHYVKGLQQKIKSDNMSMLHPVNINNLIEQELDLCNHNLFFKHYITLKKSLTKNIPDIYAVYGDISLCVANILNNAIESMQECDKKMIQVKTFFEDNMIGISIKDTGIGIEKKHLDKIFESYFSTKEESNSIGFGLGLAISKHVIDKYRGKILVNSKMNKGSEFILLLPILEKKRRLKRGDKR